MCVRRAAPRRRARSRRGRRCAPPARRAPSGTPPLRPSRRPGSRAARQAPARSRVGGSATRTPTDVSQTVVEPRALPCPDGLARLRVACEQDDAARLRRASHAVDDPLRNVTLLLVCLPLNLRDPAVLAWDERPDPLDVAPS